MTLTDVVVIFTVEDATDQHHANRIVLADLTKHLANTERPGDHVFDWRVAPPLKPPVGSRYDGNDLRALLDRAALLLEHPDMPQCVGVPATLHQLRKTIEEITSGAMVVLVTETQP